MAMCPIETIELRDMDGPKNVRVMSSEMTMTIRQPGVGDLVVVNKTNVRLTECTNINTVETHTNRVFHNGKVVEALPLPKYLWRLSKNSTKMERYTCAFVTLTVLCTVAVVIYHFSVVSPSLHDTAPADWYITRDLWSATPLNETEAINYHPPVKFQYMPIQLVVIQHAVSPTCYNFAACAAAMHTLQDYYIQSHLSDIPYSFLIGNDGRVYEGRGWEDESVSSRWLNRCLISIGFVGDYRYIEPTPQQINRTELLLAEGVREGYLHPEYTLVGALDLLPTESPGTNLYLAIQDLEHYVEDNIFHNKSCGQIHEADTFVDEAPHEWYITLDDWDADPYDNVPITQYTPPRLVIIIDVPTRDCYVFIVCRSQMINLQGNYFLKNSETPYNFVIGNDGRVYETRGWGVEAGVEVEQYKPCALYIAFFGNYTDYRSITEARVSSSQVNRTQMLLEEGVSKGYLHPEYIVVGAKDILPRYSPGTFLYNEIQTWDHYDDKRLNEDSTCDSLL